MFFYELNIILYRNLNFAILNWLSKYQMCNAPILIPGALHLGINQLTRSSEEYPVHQSARSALHLSLIQLYCIQGAMHFWILDSRS